MRLRGIEAPADGGFDVDRHALTRLGSAGHGSGIRGDAGPTGMGGLKAGCLLLGRRGRKRRVCVIFQIERLDCCIYKSATGIFASLNFERIFKRQGKRATNEIE